MRNLPGVNRRSLKNMIFKNDNGDENYLEKKKCLEMCLKLSVSIMISFWIKIMGLYY